MSVYYWRRIIQNYWQSKTISLTVSTAFHHIPIFVFLLKHWFWDRSLQTNKILTRTDPCRCAVSALLFPSSRTRASPMNSLLPCRDQRSIEFEELHKRAIETYKLFMFDGLSRVVFFSNDKQDSVKLALRRPVKIIMKHETHLPTATGPVIVSPWMVQITTGAPIENSGRPKCSLQMTPERKIP